MAARSVPAEPSFRTTSERQVWQRVTKQLGPGCLVLATATLDYLRTWHHRLPANVFQSERS